MYNTTIPLIESGDYLVGDSVLSWVSCLASSWVPSTKNPLHY